ncbi:MAG: choice-of-anchor tandem repeat GloVer-containing protein [Terriglobales bacterium]
MTRITLLSLLILTLISRVAVAQMQYRVVYNFGTNSVRDAALPNGGLIMLKGVLYGTSWVGGQTYETGQCSGGCGTVFALESFYGNPAEAVIYSFCKTADPNTCADGAFPVGGLISDASGNLYGTAQGGGSEACVDGGLGGCGVAFRLSRSGKTWTETVLYSFTGPDGERPTSTLTFDSKGNLYGTTVFGGAYGAGNVFELTPGLGDIWTETTLHDFNPAIGDGAEPFLSGVTFDSAGNLFGTTATSGTGKCQFDQYAGCGTLFELSPNPDGTWDESILFELGKNLAFPEATLVFDNAGRLYGTTYGGGGEGCGLSCGSVFRLTPQGGAWKAQTFLFSGSNGEAPMAGVSLKDGNLYGTTTAGGSKGYGVLYKIQNGIETVLHDFSGYPGDGANPQFGGAMLWVDGNFYGVTSSGGTNEWGTIFQLTP